MDELGITAGATAYEIKSLYGRAATTASRRCKGLLTYGLCKLFALVIFNEEKIFKESFSAAIGLERPMAPIREQFPDEMLFMEAAREFEALNKEFEGALNSQIGESVQNRTLPPGTVGLIPDGDRKVEWRWKGPVFEDGTEDILNSSIVVRNLQELGVNSIEALRYLFPDKTDEERSAMLSGYPFRMAQATQQSIGTFLTLVENMRQIPHPQAPDLPMLADPKLDLTPYIYRALDFLKRELTYAGQYSDDTGGGDPAGLDPIERARADAGLPISTGPERPTFVPDSFGASAGGAGSGQLPAGGAPGQPMAAGVRAPQRQLDRDAELPTSGSLLNSDPAGSPYTNAGMAGFGSSAVPGGAFNFGAADLNSPSNAGVLPGPDTGAQLQQRADSTRERRVSRKRKQRKS
ncbi:MAG TPA: hypothetical protein DCX77_00845 [Acidimicrobiaceae bacterium]|nr:hypothetical protein [Acidimicrobiaceae bacterium]